MCFDGIDFLQTPRRIGPCVKYSPTASQIELLPARALNKPSVHPRISVFDYSFQGCSMRILSSFCTGVLGRPRGMEIFRKKSFSYGRKPAGPA